MFRRIIGRNQVKNLVLGPRPETNIVSLILVLNPGLQSTRILDLGLGNDLLHVDEIPVDRSHQIKAEVVLKAERVIGLSQELHQKKETDPNIGGILVDLVHQI